MFPSHLGKLPESAESSIPFNNTNNEHQNRNKNSNNSKNNGFEPMELGEECPRSDEEFPAGSMPSGFGHRQFSASSAMAKLLATMPHLVSSLFGPIPSISSPSNLKSDTIPSTPLAEGLPLRERVTATLPLSTSTVFAPPYPLFGTSSTPNLHANTAPTTSGNQPAAAFYLPQQRQRSPIPATLAPNFEADKTVAEALLTSPQALTLSGLLPAEMLENAQLWDQWLCQLATRLSSSQWHCFWRHYASLFGLKALPPHLLAFFNNSSLSQFTASGGSSAAPDSAPRTSAIDPEIGEIPAASSLQQRRQAICCPLDDEQERRVRDMFYQLHNKTAFISYIAQNWSGHFVKYLISQIARSDNKMKL